MTPTDRLPNEGRGKEGKGEETCKCREGDKGVQKLGVIKIINAVFDRSRDRLSAASKTGWPTSFLWKLGEKRS